MSETTWIDNFDLRGVYDKSPLHDTSKVYKLKEALCNGLRTRQSLLETLQTRRLSDPLYIANADEILMLYFQFAQE